MERQSVDLDPQIGRQPEQVRDRVRFAAELARQIDPGLGAAERNADQQRAAVAVLDELAQLIRIVDDESIDAVGQGGSDIAVAFDRVRVNAAFGRHLQAPHQFHFTVGGQIEARALGIAAC